MRDDLVLWQITVVKLCVFRGRREGMEKFTRNYSKLWTLTRIMASALEQSPSLHKYYQNSCQGLPHKGSSHPENAGVPSDSEASLVAACAVLSAQPCPKPARLLCPWGVSRQEY